MAHAMKRIERWRCKLLRGRCCKGRTACSASLAILFGVLLGVLLIGRSYGVFPFGSAQNPGNQETLNLVVWLLVLVGIPVVAVILDIAA